MDTLLFANLPVHDLARSKRFYESLGFAFNPRFSDDTAACLVLSDHNYAMLLTHEKFQQFTPKAIADATKVAQVLLAISRPSREEVEAICRKAFASGGRRYKDPQDHGFMYAWGFEDPDGHVWEPFWMDPKAAAPDAAAEASPPR